MYKLIPHTTMFVTFCANPKTGVKVQFYKKSFFKAVLITIKMGKKKNAWLLVGSSCFVRCEALKLVKINLYV